jgi:biopolymer transport protein ExbD
MAIKRNRRFHAEVATSALSDIMFFLLLFFLIISTLANPNVIKVPLPESKGNEKTQKAHVTLTVTQEKKYFIDKKEIAFSSLEAELLAATQQLNDNTVILRIPFDLKVQDLVDLLQIGMKNNLKVIIATKGEGGGE